MTSTLYFSTTKKQLHSDKVKIEESRQTDASEINL